MKKSVAAINAELREKVIQDAEGLQADVFVSYASSPNYPGHVVGIYFIREDTEIAHYSPLNLTSLYDGEVEARDLVIHFYSRPFSPWAQAQHSKMIRPKGEKK